MALLASLVGLFGCKKNIEWKGKLEIVAGGKKTTIVPEVCGAGRKKESIVLYGKDSASVEAFKESGAWFVMIRPPAGVIADDAVVLGKSDCSKLDIAVEDMGTKSDGRIDWRGHAKFECENQKETFSADVTFENCH